MPELTLPPLTHPLVLFALFVLGTIIGSFLNVVVYRLPVMLKRQWQQQCEAYLAAEQGNKANPPESTNTFNLALPHSHCPHCQTPIKPWHNLPIIGYFLLKGRCHACQEHIPARYPWIEFIAGVIAVIATLHFTVSAQFIAAIGISYTLLCLALIDVDHQLLPDTLTLPLMWAGLLFNTLSSHAFAAPSDAILGAVIGYLLLWVIYQVHKTLTGKEGMGYGDFKLTAAAGAWLGWQALPLLLLLAAGAGALIGILILIKKRQGRDTPIAFGPYLAAAFWISLFWGDTLREQYLPLFAL